MKTNCIQIKIGNEVIKFSGVEVDSTSGLTSVLSKINNNIYEKELNSLSSKLKQNINILEESDITRIADYKVGNTSLFTLQSILLNKGSKYSKLITDLMNILNVIGINSKNGNILVTNTDSPKLYLGKNRNLLELPENYEHLEKHMLSGMTMLFADNQLNNVRSKLYNSIKIKYENYKANNLESDFVKNLETLPDELNKIKRFFYSVQNRDEQKFEEDIENSIKSYDPVIEINSNFFYQKEENYLYDPTHKLDEIKLEEGIKVKLGTLLDIIEETQNKIPIEETSMGKENNKIFINKLKEELTNLYSKDPNAPLWKLNNLKQLNSFQYYLKWISDYATKNKDTEYESIYNFLLTKYFDNETGINLELTKKIKETYSSLDPNIKIPNFEFVDVAYDNNVIFKPNNEIIFKEWNYETSSNKVGDDKFDRNKRIAHITGVFAKNIVNNKNLQAEFDELKNTRVTTLTFPKNIFNTVNNNVLTVLESALANGFNVILPSNNWIFNKKVYSRNEFMKVFFTTLEELQKNKYDDFKKSIYKSFYNTSRIKLTVTNKTEEIITNEPALINYDLNRLVVLSNKPNDYNFKITNKTLLVKPDFKEIKNEKGEKVIIHEYKSKNKKPFYKLTIEPVENKYKIESANIVSDNFNGANLLNNVIRDMKLKVYTYTNEEENAEKGYVKDGDIYININKDTGLNSTTLIHEMSHLLLAGMKSLNKDTYLLLIDEVNNLIAEENNLTKEENIINKEENIINTWNAIINHPVYKNLSKYDQIEELLVKLFSKTLSNEINNVTDNINFGDIVSKMFKIDAKLTNSKIVKKTIASLMVTYGSNYNNLFNSMFPMSDHLNELKLAEYKEMLIEKGKLTEQCD